MLDCRPAHRIKPRDQAAFDETRAACALTGWHYEVVNAPNEVLLGNVRWLAGYRHPRHDLPEVAEVLREIFSAPRALMSGAEVAGDPIAVLPVLFHLLWRGELHTDLGRPLTPDALVSAPTAVTT